MTLFIKLSDLIHSIVSLIFKIILPKIQGISNFSSHNFSHRHHKIRVSWIILYSEHFWIWL